VICIAPGVSIAGVALRRYARCAWSLYNGFRGFLMKTTAVEEVDEPIDVMTIFRDGAMRPVKFKRGDHAYKISRITYEWVTKEGNYPIYHFAVMADGEDVYEIYLSTLTMSWTLAKVHLK